MTLSNTTYKTEEYNRNKKYYNTYYKNNKEKHKISQKNATLKRKYGIRLEDYNKMYMSQLGLCGLCHNPFGNEIPTVDHCHASLNVRALLHKKCNIGLGHFNDNIEHLQLAIEYIKNHKLS